MIHISKKGSKKSSSFSKKKKKNRRSPRLWKKKKKKSQNAFNYIYKLIINGFPNSLLLRCLEWYLHPI
jgi:hypothetical protein